LTEEGVWQELLHNKYLVNQNLTQVEAKMPDSPFWKGLMGVKDEFFAHGVSKIGDGRDIRFWEDIWIGKVSLVQQYPSLYNIVHIKHVLIHDILTQNPLNIGFRRKLTGDKWVAWLHLCERLMEITLTNERDMFSWNLTGDRNFFS
jgi:hypothetical protein